MTYKKIIPVLLGGDLNAYGVAYSFYKTYGLKSAVFARARLGLTDNSEFIELHIHEGLDDFNIAVPLLLDFAKQRADCELILVPCADWYMEMVEYARGKLCGHFYFNIPKFEIWRAVSDKASFYKLLHAYGVSHPKYVAFYNPEEIMSELYKMKPPFVVKPADSSEYWRHKFEGMRKVYFPLDLSECKKISERIAGSGYQGKIIIQERVSSDELSSSVLTTYSNSEGRVVRAVLGDVVVEECGPTARGNYSAIISRGKNEFSNKLINMLNGIGYTGFANFDILTTRDGSFCLELNPRQGRSSDYLRTAGVDIASLLMADFMKEELKPSFAVKETLWLSVPVSIVKKYGSPPALRDEALRLYKKGKYGAVGMIKERKFKRRAYNFLHALKQRINFIKYGKEDV